MLLRILPGVLLGQWAVLLAAPLIAGLTKQENAATWFGNYLIFFVVFVVLTATARTARKAWGRGLTASGVLCWIMSAYTAIPSARLLEAASGERDVVAPTGPDALAAMASASGGYGFMLIGFWIVLGLIFVLPGIYLMRLRKTPMQSDCR
jgi:hypothetical protein